MGIKPSFCCKNQEIEEQYIITSKDEKENEINLKSKNLTYPPEIESVLSIQTTKDKTEMTTVDQQSNLKDKNDPQRKEESDFLSSELIMKNSQTELKNKEKKLILKIFHKKDNSYNFQIEIDKKGLVNSLRRKNDGYVYFGCINSEKVENDFLFISNEFTDEEKSRLKGSHFCIFFNEKIENFMIKDFGIGFGTFLKINTEHLLMENSMIHIGTTFILVNFKANKNLKIDDSLYLNIYYSNGKNLKKKVCCESKLVKIGRSPDCDIIIQDKLLSRYHCFIKYDLKKGWIISDGGICIIDGHKTLKNSSNGTW